MPSPQQSKPGSTRAAEMMAARSERPIQNLAEGGMVRGLVRKVLGIPEPTPDPTPAPAPAPAPAAAPAPKPAPTGGIGGYVGNGALDRRMKEQGLKDGGKVRGPGTGTSDSIPTKSKPGSYIMPADSTAKIGAGALEKMGTVPVNLSNGEFELPPEQVHAIGVQTLEHMKNATHTPAAQQLADGGQVDPRRGVYSDGTNTPSPGTSPQMPTAAAPLPVISAGMKPPAPTPVQPAAQPMGPPTMAMSGGAAARPGATTPPGAQTPNTPGSWSPPQPAAQPRVQPGTGPVAAAATVAPPPVMAAPAGPGAASAMANSRPPTAPGTAYPQPTYGTPALKPTSFTPPAGSGMTGIGMPSMPAAPDAQASADRAAIAGGAKSFVGGAIDTMTGSSPVGAAAADLATMIPRGIAGAWDTAVVRPVRAAGLPLPYATPGLTPDGAPDMNSATPFTDRLNKRNADAKQAAAAPIPSQGQVRAVDGNSANLAAIAAAPTGARPAPAAPEDGGSANYLQPVDPGAAPAAAPAAAAPAAAQMATPNADAVIAASNRLDQGAGIIGPADYANRNAAFNEGAALRTAAAQGSWSPRRGFQGNDDAIRAAALPMQQRAENERNQRNNDTLQTNTAVRDAGDTRRTTIREAGDDARARMADTRQREGLGIQREGLGIQRDELGMRKETADLENGVRRRLDAAQTAVLNAKTPEEQRTAADRMAALSGKAVDKFSVHEIGGGTEPIDPNDPLKGNRTLPKNLAVYNQRDGTSRVLSATPDGAAPRAPAAGREPPATAISDLKKNPKSAAQFDAIFGAGAAARALGN